MTRTASHNRLESVGAWMAVSATVLSNRTLAPLSSLAVAARASSIRLRHSKVAAAMAPMALCSADFFGDQPNGSRANARSDAESDSRKASSS